MPYIVRDANKNILRVDARPIIGAEMIAHDHPDLITFLKARGQDPTQIQKYLDELRQSDVAMSRAIEDVVMALLKKNVLKMADLPQAVQERMSYRVKLRVMIQEIYDKASSTRLD